MVQEQSQDTSRVQVMKEQATGRQEAENSDDKTSKVSDHTSFGNKIHFQNLQRFLDRKQKPLMRSGGLK